MQGERDPFGGPQEVTAAVGDRAGLAVVAVPDADHGFKVPARAPASTRAEALDIVVDAP